MELAAIWETWSQIRSTYRNVLLVVGCRDDSDIVLSAERCLVVDLEIRSFTTKLPDRFTWFVAARVVWSRNLDDLVEVTARDDVVAFVVLVYGIQMHYVPLSNVRFPRQTQQILLSYLVMLLARTAYWSTFIDSIAVIAKEDVRVPDWLVVEDAPFEHLFRALNVDLLNASL